MVGVSWYSFGPSSIELHAFCDASNYAYGVVIYLRITTGSQCQVSFVFGKSWVIPKKKILWSIPRKEFISAVTATNLLEMTRKALNLETAATYYWTDSTTAPS